MTHSRRIISLVSLVSLAAAASPPSLASTSTSTSPSPATASTAGPATTASAALHYFDGALSSTTLVRSIASTSGESLIAWHPCDDGGGGTIDDCLVIVTQRSPRERTTRVVHAEGCPIGSDADACFGGHVVAIRVTGGTEPDGATKTRAWSAVYPSFWVLDASRRKTYHVLSIPWSRFDGWLVDSSAGTGWYGTITYADGTTITDGAVATPDGGAGGGGDPCATAGDARAKAMRAARIKTIATNAEVIAALSIPTALVVGGVTGAVGTPALGLTAAALVVTAGYGWSTSYFNAEKAAAEADADALEAQIEADCRAGTSNPDPGALSIPDLNQTHDTETAGNQGDMCFTTQLVNESLDWDASNGGECCTTTTFSSCAGSYDAAGMCTEGLVCWSDVYQGCTVAVPSC